MRVPPLVGLMTVALLAVAGAGRSEERTSASNRQLEALLKRFPEADANKDGVLTEAEARAYRRQNRPQGNADAQRDRPTPTHANIEYGPHERNVLDLYLADSDKPTPLVIYIHGGGFVGGDKGGVNAGVIEKCHRSKISVASLNYRFVTTAPFPAPQRDSARAVQFLRAHATEYNLDPARFAAFGGSAGAGISLWLGFHDDMAEPDSRDPILRQSTRLVAVGSSGGQSTYDPNVIREWVGGRAFEHPSIYKCYGLESIDQMSDPKRQPLYDEVSAIKHLTADDPPVYMAYSEADAPLPEGARPGQGIHHPIFGHKLKAAMDRLGIENVYVHASQGRPQVDMTDWLIDHLRR